jgi:ketosteroid isomerase-like protein
MANVENSMGAIVRAYYKAYPDKDRPAIESLVSDDFHFTSPLDNRIDRQTYFDRCWPNSRSMSALDVKQVVEVGNTVFATYECRMNDGKLFRNTELLTLTGGKVADVEVYFGWSLPHQAPEGEFVKEKP